jgi:hypothetical protein
MGGVWGHHLPLLFSGLVLVQHCQGCRVATAAMAIHALASGQFQPLPLPGTCTTGVTRGKGGRAGMPLFDVIAIESEVVLECFGLVHVWVGH